LPDRASISAFAMRTSWRRSCLRHRAIKLVHASALRHIRGAAGPIGGRGLHSRTGCSACLRRTRRCCAGRAGWRLLFSMRCRRSNECSRALCCMAYI